MINEKKMMTRGMINKRRNKLTKLIIQRFIRKRNDKTEIKRTEKKKKCNKKKDSIMLTMESG